MTAETADGDLFEFLAGSAQVDFRVRAAKGGPFGSDSGSVARQHGQIRGPRQWPSSELTPPQGAPGGPERGEAGPLGAQPPPRVPELAAPL